MKILPKNLKNYGTLIRKLLKNGMSGIYGPHQTLLIHRPFQLDPSPSLHCTNVTPILL